MSKRIPKILYKYRSWQEEIPPEKRLQRRILTHSEIYFPCPKGFNDPFDSKILKRYDLLSIDERISFLYVHLYRKYSNLSEHEIHNKFVKELEKGKILSNSTLRKWGKRYTENLISNHGIFSTSKRNDDILMWTHYGNSHKGFCIGFDSQKLYEYLNSLGYKVGFFQVTYDNNYPTILPKIKKKDIIQNIFTQLTTKAKKWGYEKEYRYIIVEKSSIPIVIDKDIYKSITFGCEIDPDIEKELRERIHFDFPKMKFYKAFKFNDKFKLEIRKIG